MVPIVRIALVLYVYAFKRINGKCSILFVIFLRIWICLYSAVTVCAAAAVSAIISIVRFWSRRADGADVANCFTFHCVYHHHHHHSSRRCHHCRLDLLPHFAASWKVFVCSFVCGRVIVCIVHRIVPHCLFHLNFRATFIIAAIQNWIRMHTCVFAFKEIHRHTYEIRHQWQISSTLHKLCSVHCAHSPNIYFDCDVADVVCVVAVAVVVLVAFTNELYEFKNVFYAAQFDRWNSSTAPPCSSGGGSMHSVVTFLNWKVLNIFGLSPCFIFVSFIFSWNVHISIDKNVALFVSILSVSLPPIIW